MLKNLRLILRTALARKLQVPEIPLALERLVQRGFNPGTIFDVGAYQGDFAKLCLRIWPEAKIACFEAQEHKVKELRLLSSRNNAITVYPFLLGAKASETIPLHEAETASSILEEHIHQDFPVKHYRMETIDHLVDGGIDPPDFLKIDTQGYELEILKGGEKTLPKIKAVLLELNLLDIHKDVPLFGDIVEWLRQRHWVAYDICGLTRRPLDKALWQVDLIFVPENSFFRADKRWNP